MGCVCHRDEGVQLSCLRITHALLRQLPTDDIITLLPTLATFVDSRSVACRAAVYDVFMWLYDNYTTRSVQLTKLLQCNVLEQFAAFSRHSR